MPEIQVENLVKTFGEQRALDEVTFAVEEGELFTLLGPSGCGKSTTLMSIAGFQQPDEGPAAVARADDDLRHARPGRSAVDERPRRRDERRSHPAGRHARGGLPDAGE